MILRDNATFQRILGIPTSEATSFTSTVIVTQQLLKQIVRHPPTMLATCFAVGLVPRAPGTAGTVVAILPVLAMQSLPVLVQISIGVAMIVVGIIVCDMSARNLGEKDPGIIVWDEVTGFCIAMIGISIDPMTLILGFVLFRLLDILKPFPISWANARVKGGLGIMLDDVLAGLITNILLVCYMFFFMS